MAMREAVLLVVGLLLAGCVVTSSPLAAAERPASVERLLRQYGEAQEREDAERLAALLTELREVALPDARFAAGLMQDAVKQGHAAFALVLLDRGVDPTWTDSSDRHALHLAAELGDTDLVAALVKTFQLHESSIDTGDMHGLTPLSLAITKAHLPVIDLLLAAGASVEGARMNAPLETAIRNRHDQAEAVLRHLLEQIDAKTLLREQPKYVRAAMTYRDGRRLQILAPYLGMDAELPGKEGGSWLHLAARNGDADSLRFFHAAGVDPERLDKGGYRAIEYAMKEDSTECFATMLALGADFDFTNKRGEQLIHRLSKGGHVDLLAVLLDAGAAIDAKDAQGNTALLLAARTGRQGICHYLLLRGAEVEAGERSPVAFAQAAGHQQLAAWFQTQGIAGGLPTSRLLVLAAQRGQRSELERLLAAADSTSADKREVLRWALIQGDEDLARQILATGMAPEDLGEGLSLAAAQFRKDLVARILELGCRVDQGDGGDVTALTRLLRARGGVLKYRDRPGVLRNRGRDYDETMQAADGVLQQLLAAGAQLNSGDWYLLVGQKDLAGIELCFAKLPPSAEQLMRLIDHAACKLEDAEIVRCLYTGPVTLTEHQAEELLRGVCDHPSMVTLLIGLGVRVDTPDEPARQRPLHTAIEYKRPDTAAILLEAGAPVNALNALGQTAVDLAGNDEGLLRLLRQRGGKMAEELEATAD